MSNEIENNISLAKAVSAGESNACRTLVDDHTDIVLSKVWNLAKTHCQESARSKMCSLLVLQKQRKGIDYFVEDQCDKCLDSYVWFFDYLKNKVKAYKGKNNCKLSTFVWSVINSDTTYKDWLRWKYGRAY